MRRGLIYVLKSAMSLPLLVALQLWLPSPVSAETSDPSLAEVAAESYMPHPGAYKATFVVIVRMATELEIANNPIYKVNPRSFAENYRRERTEWAETTVDGVDFRNGYLEALGKDVVDNLSAAARAKKFPVFSNLGKKLLADLLDRAAIKGETPQLDPQLVKYVMAGMFEAAKNPKSADYKYSRDLLQKYLALDPNVGYEFLGGVRAHFQNEKLEKKLQELKDKLASLDKKSSKDRAVLEQMRNETAEMFQELNETMAESLRDMWASGKLTPEELARAAQADINRKKADHLKFAMGEVGDMFGAMAGMATLAGDKEAAEFFTKAAALSQAISQVMQLSVVSSFSQQPMAFTNAYVAVVVLLANFSKAQQDQANIQALSNQIQKLAIQINELRIYLADRLDILDYKLAHYYEKSYADIQSINANVGLLRQDAAQIQQQLARTRFEINSGLKFLWLSQMVDWQSLCLSHDAQGHAISREKITIIRCRNQFAQVAVGNWDTALPGPMEAIRPLGKISESEYQDLRASLAQFDPSQAWNQISVHPANWLLGAKWFLQFFHVNVRYTNYAKDANIPDGANLSLANLIATGERVKQGVNTLVLGRVQNGYRLKKDLLLKLLAQYRKDAWDAIAQGNAAALSFAKNGPKPALGVDAPPIVDNEYSFFTNPAYKVIDFCDDSPKKVVIGKLYETFGRDAFVRNEYLAFYKDWFSWNASLLNLIPNSVLWAARTDFENIQVKPCFNKVEVPVYTQSMSSLTYQFRFELQFRIHTSKMPSGKWVIASSSALDEGSVTRSLVLDFKRPMVHPMLHNYWNGQICDTSCSFSWPAVKTEGGRRFKLIPIMADPEFTAFENRLKADFALKSAQAREQLDRVAAGKTSVTANRLMFLVASLGLDPAQDGVNDFLTWLGNEETLPLPEGLARVALEKNLTPEQIMRILDTRIAAGKQRVEKLAERTDLQPREQEISRVLLQLEALPGAGRSWRSLRFPHRIDFASAFLRYGSLRLARDRGPRLTAIEIRPCAATGQPHVRRAHRKPNARPARNAGSNAGSTKPFLETCKRGSTVTQTRCALTANRQADAVAQAAVNARSYTHAQPQWHTPVQVQQQEQRHLQQKRDSEALVQSVVKVEEQREFARLLQNYEDATKAQTSVQMIQLLRFAEGGADNAVNGHRLTPEHRQELLKIAADIQEDIAKLQVAEAAAIESQRVATGNKELIQQKQAAEAATKAEKAADEGAFNNADTSAYPACPAPAANEMLPSDGVGFRNGLDLQVGQQIIDVTFACVQKAGFTVHEVVPGKEPAYEAALKKCAIIQSAYYARCANEILLK